MKTKIIAIVIASTLLLATFSAIGAVASTRNDMRMGTRSEAQEMKEQEPNENKPEMPKMTALAYHDLWRKLWEDHVWWTRMVIIGILDNLGGAGNYTQRLLQNVPDMKKALMPFYSAENVTKFGDLLTDHLVIAADILTKAKAGQNITDTVDSWYKNANEIAAFMNELNPNQWPLEEAKALWKMHLDLTLEEAVAHLKMDWKADMEAFDKIHEEALKMADFISKGIILQFPERFIMLGTIVHP